MKLKTIEPLVLNALENNELACSDDFILYGSVLKRLNIDLKMPIGEMLANHSNLGIPSFESVTRCRRHIQELRTDLQDSETAVAREIKQDDYKIYNLSGINNWQNKINGVKWKC